MIILYGLILFLFSFSLRALFLVFNGSDAFVHLWQTKKASLLGLGNHKAFQSVSGGYKGYPHLHHYFVSRFRKDKYLFAGRVLNILYDTLWILGFYFLLEWLGNAGVGMGFLTSGNAFLIAMVAGSTPIFFPLTARLLSLGGRTLGGLLCFLFFIFIGWSITGDNYLGYLLAIPTGILILMASQFGMQVMVFFSIILSVLYLNPLIILTVILAFLAGIILKPTGIYDFLLYSKLNHYMWYFKNQQKGAATTDKNSLGLILKLPYFFFKNQRKFRWAVLHKISPTILIFLTPILVFGGILLCMGDNIMGEMLDNPYLKYSLFLVLSAFIVFIITSLKPFLFLGEAERYFEYVIPFLSLIVLYQAYSVFGGNVFIPFLALLAINFVIIVFNFLYLTEDFKGASLDFKLKLETDLLDLNSFIGNQTEGLRIITVPIKLSFILSFLNENKNHLFYYRRTGHKLNGFKDSEEDEPKFELIRTDKGFFEKKYGINTFVLEKLPVNKATEIGYYYEEVLESYCEKVFENDTYLVYSTKSNG